ncbi:MAG TPA: hypothetical protein QGF58_03390 [Myxococcota bacterium]|nr:hypothetical protein [Myxococcota bacterium]
MLQRAIDAAAFLATDPIGQARPGASPHTVIHSQASAKLRFFASTGRRALFVCMPLINTWTIWDLLPGHSVVAALVDAGIDVYVLDWGKPGPEAEDRPLDHYVDEILGRALDRARRHAGTTLDVAGYCVGGTFLAWHLARNRPEVRSAAFVATPIDFHASGRLSRWADPAHFPLDALHGNFPAERLRASFAWLKPMGQARKWRSLLERPQARELWAHLESWSRDGVDFPGRAYREYVRACYFDNRLREELGGVDVPALSVAASRDHIVPPPAAHDLSAVWDGPVTERTLRGGHVGICLEKALPAALSEWLS